MCASYFVFELGIKVAHGAWLSPFLAWLKVDEGKKPGSTMGVGLRVVGFWPLEIRINSGLQIDSASSLAVAFQRQDHMSLALATP
jgi:hypothetical protein